jgi:hypothetical protein
VIIIATDIITDGIPQRIVTVTVEMAHQTITTVTNIDTAHQNTNLRHLPRTCPSTLASSNAVI